MRFSGPACVSLGLVWGLVSASLAGSPLASEFSDQTDLVADSHRVSAIPTARRDTPVGATIVWDSGGFVTHLGAGFEGADVSMASENVNSAGDNVRQLEGNEYFRIADRFEFSEKTGLVQLSTFGYEPFVAPPNWSSRNLKIWSGVPGEPESILVFEREYSGLDAQFTGVYRILHLDDLNDARRPIYEIFWDLTSDDSSAPLWLEAGEYWIDWQVVGGATGWSIYVMQANPDDLDQPETSVGDARQLRPIGWVGIEVATPFLLFGLSEGLFQDRFEAAPLGEASGEPVTR